MKSIWNNCCFGTKKVPIRNKAAGNQPANLQKLTLQQTYFLHFIMRLMIKNWKTNDIVKDHDHNNYRLIAVIGQYSP